MKGASPAVADRLASGPFTHEVIQLLRLGNPSNDPIAFKVYTYFVADSMIYKLIYERSKPPRLNSMWMLIDFETCD